MFSSLLDLRVHRVYHISTWFGQVRESYRKPPTSTLVNGFGNHVGPRTSERELTYGVFGEDGKLTKLCIGRYVEFAPRLDLKSLSSCSPSAYLAFMIDIDIIRDGRTVHLLHWYQPDLVLAHKTHELVQTCSDRKGALYGAPAPPGGSSHRYVELVFQQPLNFTFPESFEHYLEPTIPARLFFNITEFAAAAELGNPVAANYFTVLGTRTSTEEQQIIEL
uniref:Phomoidride biosynthesis cluster protein N n=1 Tax=Fungal sp. (strain ATCC 74256) TaxID=1729595 RepID=PHIN_FUNX7|nr:RecName: Full=Phomoidride biosynthesis cluster protein N [fungal sp. ATCC 74256]BBG28511.1 putative hypothetical protein [fungal sp. ATCC 74256]